MKCIMTLDVSHNTQMNWPQQMPSLLGPLVAGDNYYNKKEKVPVTSSHYDVITWCIFWGTYYLRQHDLGVLMPI